MENSSGLYPRDSLAHLLGKRLEQVLPEWQDRVVESRFQSQFPSRSSAQRHGISPLGEEVIRNWVPCVGDSNREYLSHHSVRRGGSIIRVQLR